MIERRSFLSGLASVIAAPAVVPFASLMQVRGIVMDAGLVPRTYEWELRRYGPRYLSTNLNLDGWTDGYVRWCSVPGVKDFYVAVSP